MPLAQPQDAQASRGLCSALIHGEIAKVDLEKTGSLRLYGRAGVGGTVGAIIGAAIIEALL